MDNNHLSIDTDGHDDATSTKSFHSTNSEQKSTRNKDVTNRKIFSALLKRDSREKNVAVRNLIEANDALIRMVSTLKMELDERDFKANQQVERVKLMERRIKELEVLLQEKNRMIVHMQKESRTSRKIDDKVTG